MESYSKVRAGDHAPSFTLPDDVGNAVSLNALRGKRVVLYFYPKDDTPGCTVEACEFRDLLPRFAAQDVAVFGISPDSPRKHARFKAKHHLPFPLLSDEDHAVCEAYGVWREKLFWGRKYMAAMRTTYVISSTGTVEHVWEHVSHEGHAAEVDAWLRGNTLPERKPKPKSSKISKSTGSGVSRRATGAAKKK